MRKFSGNFLFASLNSCRGNNKSRRDDLESVMYILIYLLNDNYLPWCDIEEKYIQGGMDFKAVLRERLEIEYTKRLFAMIPSKHKLFTRIEELIHTFKKVLTLKFEEQPDYERIIRSLNKCLKNYQAAAPSVPAQFEWNVSIVV